MGGCHEARMVLGGGVMARFGYLTYSRGRITLGTLKKTMLLSAPRTGWCKVFYSHAAGKGWIVSRLKLKGMKGWKRKWKLPYHGEQYGEHYEDPS